MKREGRQGGQREGQEGNWRKKTLEMFTDEGIINSMTETQS